MKSKLVRIFTFPVCARKGLAALEALKDQPINDSFRDDMQRALDGIVASLDFEGKTLNRLEDHQSRVAELTSGTDRSRALEISYEILGDVFSTLPIDARIQGAVGVLFLTVGATDEAEAAKKRLKTLAKKFASF